MQGIEMVREVGDGDVFPQGKVAAGTSGCLRKCIRWMSEIKGFQEEGAPWFGAINGDCVGFLISALALGSCGCRSNRGR